MARLQKGVNDLKSWCLDNGSWGKQLMDEWTGIQEDGELYEMDGVYRGSSKKFKWRCLKGHEWFTMVTSRVSRKNKCPYCSGRRASNENNLKIWCLNNGSFGKQLLSEWTGECTDGKRYKIDEVTKASGKRFKWRCSKGHQWCTVVADRTKSRTSCPNCSNSRRGEKVSNTRLKKGVNDLKTWCLDNGDFGKQLMSEWTGDCDDGTHYEIDEVSFGSSRKKFKWICSEGHEWFTTITYRTVSKCGCYYCSKESRGELIAKAKLSKENSLKTWCLDNGDFGKQLMSEWTGDCDDGTHYEIDEVSFGSSRKKFKWTCSKGHKWFVKVNDRTSQRQGCPYCYRENRSEIVTKARLSENNSLKTWCLSNGLIGEQLMSEWTGECTNGKHYKIDEVAKASRKQFKWKCSNKHEWYAALYTRTLAEHGCPYCSGRRVSGENSLKTWCSTNGPFGQQLIKEWTGECVDGKHYSLNQIHYGSTKRLKWKCSNGHEWLATTNSRTNNRTICPYCSGHLVSNKNSLKTWCSNNNSWGKQLISEWTGECNDGKRYNIDEVSYGSQKKFKWDCSKGHEWYTTIAIRTLQKCGCPYCNTQSTSYPEQFIYHSLKQIYTSAENRCKVLKSIQNPQGVEFDIGIPEVPLCIEYSPTYWHKGKEERDQYKKDICQKANVRFIQIVEDSYNELEHIKSDDYICFKMHNYYRDEILTEIVDHILKTLGHSISEIDLELVKQEAYESSKRASNQAEDIAIKT